MKTRASGSSWEKDDAIGVYMLQTGEPLSLSSPRRNVKYVTSGSPVFEPADRTEEITLPFDGSGVDFIGYYPYREDTDNLSYPVDLSDQSLQTGIDLMYSDNAKNFNSKNPNVQMQFAHQLSKVVLNIRQDEPANLNGLSVFITNAGIRATFDLVTGSLSVASERGDIQFKVNNDGTVAEAILLPETGLSEMELWFVAGDGSGAHKFSLANAIGIDSFEKSTRYVYNVLLLAGKATVVAENGITDWIDAPSVEVEADYTTEIPLLDKGSKEFPYTVAEVQAGKGKAGVWVKGYITGSFDGSINKFIPGSANAVSSNIALADSPDETDAAKMIPVQLSSSTKAVKDALNIPDNPDIINRAVIIKGTPANYFSVPGLREPKDYLFINE